MHHVLALGISQTEQNIQPSPCCSCGPAQKVHPLNSKKIEDLVREGAVDANEVQRSLREYNGGQIRDKFPIVVEKSQIGS